MTHKTSATRTFKELDVVAIKAHGTIITLYGDGDAEVEFIDENGKTVDIVDINARLLEKV